ncbi:G patch domain-containing protein TGH [Quillaja saponaria]|uniref:G patch domain-containing protein TGH n=1 Tax=Quillaja saponaria TaxID=32244 RepID=A0AAD7VK30_QUISA|nr:G patch domain-containing protein TGH [Quillaja saponaria]
MEEPAISKKELLPLLQSDSGDISKNEAENEMDVEVEVGNVERPVDLYKAIFSDDSDEEQEDSNLRRAEYQEKKFEADNTALNPLIAGDFLESLGKEPGLEVPPEFPCPVQKTRNPAPQKENVDARNASINNSSSPHAFGVTTGLGIPKLQEEFSRNGRTEEDSKVRTPLIHQQKYSSSSSSEDERSRKRSRRHQRGSSDRK